MYGKSESLQMTWPVLLISHDLGKTFVDIQTHGELLTQNHDYLFIDFVLYSVRLHTFRCVSRDKEQLRLTLIKVSLL